jgi:hypothetical protein
MVPILLPHPCDQTRSENHIGRRDAGIESTVSQPGISRQGSVAPHPDLPVRTIEMPASGQSFRFSNRKVAPSAKVRDIADERQALDPFQKLGCERTMAQVGPIADFPWPNIPCEG